jgi:hypothetical protein
MDLYLYPHEPEQICYVVVKITQILKMLNLSSLRTAHKNIFVSFTVGLMTLTGFVAPSLSKPSNWSFKIGDFVRFDFQGCSKSANKDNVICVGNFRSRNGEQGISVPPGSGNERFISITDSRGKVHFADEVRIGDKWTCQVGENCNLTFSRNFTLVEGVDYKTVFIFKDTSILSSKLPLFQFQVIYHYDNISSSMPIKIKARNINITSSGEH